MLSSGRGPGHLSDGKVDHGRVSAPRMCEARDMTHAASASATVEPRTAKYGIGAVVRHRVYPFRGVVFDIDPVFNNTEEWWNAIPEEIRPNRDQPFYHLFAENDETEYVAYVSEQNLVPDTSADPLRHPQVSEVFVKTRDGRLKARAISMQ
jgi:heat shock protein HspQ